MIQYKIGNLLDITEGHIVHSANAQGIMGAGVALAIKQKYPGCYQEYKEFCAIASDSAELLGRVVPYLVNEKLIIWNLIGQDRYGGHGKRYTDYEALATGLEMIEKSIISCRDNYVVPPILNFPLMGSGLGGGKWPIVEAIIDNTISCGKVLWTLD